MNKILFLDIDGVLNVITKDYDEYGGIFHPHFVANLKDICDKTSCKLVITSTWRFMGLERLSQMWSHRELPGKIIGRTPLLDTKRGEEIKHWLENSPNTVDKYCIIDDDTDFLPEQMPYFVKTSGNMDHTDFVDLGYGLTKECAQQVIKILS